MGLKGSKTGYVYGRFSNPDWNEKHEEVLQKRRLKNLCKQKEQQEKNGGDKNGKADPD